MDEPETQGHGAARGARFAAENGNLDRAIGHLAGGVSWSADTLLMLEQRLIAVEAWAQEQGYVMAHFPEPDDDAEEYDPDAEEDR
jgi:hypothetical protein